MERQSNTLLFVAGACVALIVGIVIAVRILSPEDARSASSLSSLRLASSSAANQAPIAELEGQGPVQMLPITVEGKQGLLVRYTSDLISDPIQQKIASRVLDAVKREAQKAQIEVIVVIAVKRSQDGGSTLDAQTHTVAFRHLGEGVWVKVQDPHALAPDSSTLPPASVSPLTRTH